MSTITFIKYHKDYANYITLANTACASISFKIIIIYYFILFYCYTNIQFTASPDMTGYLFYLHARSHHEEPCIQVPVAPELLGRQV